MIEVIDITPVEKGSVLARCDVRIKPWSMILKNVTVFQKGTQRWLGMPSRQFEKDGEVKYEELIQFEGGAAKRFRDQVMGAIEKWLEGHPDMKLEPLIKDEDMPF